MKKKLCLLGGYGNRSGVPKYVTNLYLLLREDFEVTVVVDSNLGGYDLIDSQNLMTIKGLASNTSLLAKMRAFSKLKYTLNDFDIVWAHSSFSILFARLIAIFSSYKLIITYHGLPYGSGRRPIISITAFLVEFFSSKITKHLIVVISHMDKMNIRKIYPRAQIFYIPNAVGDEIVSETQAMSNDPTLLMIARDSYQKDIDYAVELLNKLPHLKLHVFGEISDYRRQLLMDANVANNIEFFGEVPFKSINFSNYSIYLLTSRYEGFSLSLLEAMANGLSIATTNVGGAYEVLQKNEFSQNLTKELQHDISTINGLLAKDPMSDEVRGKIKFLAQRHSFAEWKNKCREMIQLV